MAEELEHEPQPQEPRTELPEEGAAPADGAEPEKKEKKPSEDLFYWLNALTTALVSLVLVFTFIGRLTRVQGESMTNTLQDQQLLLVWSLGYEPKQGDIVVLNKTTVEHLGGVAIVKRVIATGGMGRMMAEYCDLIDDVDPNLTLEGLRLIYENNREAFENRKLDMNNSVIEVTEEGAWQENK